MKGVAYFNHKHGCQKCTVEGKHHSAARVIYFPDIDAPVRTDEDFRALKYGDHHRETSPFIDLLFFDMIKGFPTSDCLHLLDYEITRTYVNCLKSGKLGLHRKWSPDTISRINNVLQNVEIPIDYHR
uniref:Uncharacterized protein n=1 Tax=Anopheles stephensi TaxID=30069 RepID=A0A182YA17_ANOST